MALLCNRFGNYKTGWLFYEKDVNFVKASNEVYFEKMLVEGGMAHFMHGFMSMESQAELYNETFRNSDKVKQFKLFLAMNPNVGKHFDKKIKAKPSDDEFFVPMSEDFNEKDAEEKGHSTYSGMYEMHRKSVSSAFFNYWTLCELRERNLLSKYFFGPYYYEEDGTRKLCNYKESVDTFQCKVDRWRTDELYPHDECTGITIDSFDSYARFAFQPSAKNVGVGKCTRQMDSGNWDIQFGKLRIC